MTKPPDAALVSVVDALGGRARFEAPLGARTTYRVGGPAAALVEVGSQADLQAVHRALAAAEGTVPVLVVGQGSNMLVADAGFPGLVVVLGGGLAAVDVSGGAGRRGAPGPPGGHGGPGLPGGAPHGAGDGCGDRGTEPGAVAVHAGGGARLPVVARRSAAAGLRGLEWAVGIPGSVGGAVRMNAGGHGSDVAAVLLRCWVFDLRTGRASERCVSDLHLGYRSSALSPDEVVVWADLRAAPGDRLAAEAAIADVVRWRREHQPGGANAGSVFTNPAGDAAGRLVEEAGLKGMRIGTARVSPKHANFVQADPGGTAADVRRVIDHVRAEVERRTGVVLHTEVKLVGFDDGDEPAAGTGRP